MGRTVTRIDARSGGSVAEVKLKLICPTRITLILLPRRQGECLVIRPTRRANQSKGAERTAKNLAHAFHVGLHLQGKTHGKLTRKNPTDEYRYSDDLRINLIIKHSDPRTGSVTMTVTQVIRTEPDSARFEIPDGYKPTGTGPETDK
jgi:hypothetical protein